MFRSGLVVRINTDLSCLRRAFHEGSGDERYRTTNEINSFAQKFRTGKNILVGHIIDLPEIITYKDEKDFEKKLRSRCRPKEGVPNSFRNVMKDKLRSKAYDLGTRKIFKKPIKYVYYFKF